ncbi:MAG: Nif3-like dinuclear metal center hexameric protein [Spirochaetes bacterium GWF1_51_8]|nr:MAG: Nif3-like dinuclear metal center hexameric protein [Spirochaetes bacterium GWF1_51_8]
MTGYLDSLFDGFTGEDSTYNGLQVEGAGEITAAAFGVDCSLEGFRRAADEGCQLLVTHHGLIWGGWSSVAGNDYLRLKTLIDNQINLYVRHLPLDIHPEYGNNAGIIRALGAERKEVFAEYGFFAEFPSALSAKEFRPLVAEKINPDSEFMDFGPDRIERIAVCSGSLRPGYLAGAVSGGAQALVTGEGSSPSLFYYPALESKIHIAFAGHYATEVYGVRSLMELVKKNFPELKTIWIDMPTGW